MVTVGAVTAVSAYGLMEAALIRIEQVEISSDKLPTGMDRLRIVQICDVHLSPTVGVRRLRRIARMVRGAEPDIIVCVGDLLDSTVHAREELCRVLAALESPLGKYASTGNHEYYAGLEKSIAFTEEAGFRLLRNESERIRPGLSVVGVEDRTARRVRGATWDEQDVLRMAEAGDFVVLLKHRPFVEVESLPLVDLQLSGHTHGGQIFPFSIAIWLYYEYGHGLVRVGESTHLYTSRGTGTWGPPMRVLNPPEVTVIDVVRADIRLEDGDRYHSPEGGQKEGANGAAEAAEGAAGGSDAVSAPGGGGDC